MTLPQNILRLARRYERLYALATDESRSVYELQRDGPKAKEAAYALADALCRHIKRTAKTAGRKT